MDDNNVQNSLCINHFNETGTQWTDRGPWAFYFHILGLNFKMSYQIASLFHMYIDMGERIAGKQDRFSLIIEDPPQGPQNTPKINIFFTF